MATFGLVPGRRTGVRHFLRWSLPIRAPGERGDLSGPPF
jgi:hypothetical protein